MRRDPRPLWRRLFTKKALLVLAALAVFAVGSGLIQLVIRRRSVDADIARLEAEARELEGKNGEMTTLIQRFQTTAFLEREARLKLNMQKPGEEVIVIERNDTATPTALTAVVGAQTPNWKRWWWYFFDREQLAKAD